MTTMRGQTGQWPRTEQQNTDKTNDPNESIVDDFELDGATAQPADCSEVGAARLPAGTPNAATGDANANIAPAPVAAAAPKREDRIDKIENWARSNPYLALVILAYLVVTSLLATVDVGFKVWEKVSPLLPATGEMAKRAAQPLNLTPAEIAQKFAGMSREEAKTASIVLYGLHPFSCVGTVRSITHLRDTVFVDVVPDGVTDKDFNTLRVCCIMKDNEVTHYVGLEHTRVKISGIFTEYWEDCIWVRECGCAVPESAKASAAPDDVNEHRNH